MSSECRRHILLAAAVSLSVCAACLTAACVGTADSAPIAASPRAAETSSPFQPTSSATDTLPLELPMDVPASRIRGNEAVIGLVGDLGVTQGMLRPAYDEATGIYSFSECLAYSSELFHSVDLMCGNLETPLAGPEAGYAGSAVPEYAEGFPRGSAMIAFNAPDVFASDLAVAGFDVLTTANNHMFDRGERGALRTLDVLDALPVTHTGSARSPKERERPCIVSVNGIRVGIVAVTDRVNHLWNLSSYRLSYLLNLVQDKELARRDITACREEGAEFILVFAHWGEDGERETDERTQALAREFISCGADAVIGSHPHVAQECAMVDVENETGTRRGFVAYSLGNCLLGRNTGPLSCGLFLKLFIARDENGVVRLERAEHVPLATVMKNTARGELPVILPGGSYRDALPPDTEEQFASSLNEADALINGIMEGYYLTWETQEEP